VAPASAAPLASGPFRTPSLPELPDIELYIDRLRDRIDGHRLERVQINNPFFVRSVQPSPDAAEGRIVEDLSRIGKRIAIGLEGDLWMLVHLMIAGRLQWQAADFSPSGKQQLAAFGFAGGTLLVTEAGTRKRASLHILGSKDELMTHDPGGLEPLECRFDVFCERLDTGNHTLKRALTDPTLFSGIGNAYSDEILHAARLSPVKLTHGMTMDEKQRLFDATRKTLAQWTERLRQESPEEFPKRVTAFKEGMATHGKYGEPCPVCGSPIQRIRYKSNETNYCARCQTGGKVLADRSLSRLLKTDWPKSIDEL
jgi:formamidopyrimidine-DNA glycosylase